MTAGREPGAGASVAGGRGTLAQRARIVPLRVASFVLTHLPTGLVGAGADAAGELWYRLSPGRAAMARANLGRVCAHLAATGQGSARARDAGTDPRELERLVRAAYRHAARTYLELLRRPVIARELWRRTVVEQPETVDPAFSSGAAVFATMHFGSIQAIAEVLSRFARTPVTAPMETLADPELQAFLARGRSATGLRIVSLGMARRELRAALTRGELVGLVADRDILGGGIEVSLFGHPAPLPAGPAMLAVEFSVPIHVAAVRRIPHERYAGHLVSIQPAEVAAAAGTTRRARVEAALAAEARVFEHFVMAAPEQWWAVFFPIWPDLGPAPRG